MLVPSSSHLDNISVRGRPWQRSAWAAETTNRARDGRRRTHAYTAAVIIAPFDGTHWSTPIHHILSQWHCPTLERDQRQGLWRSGRRHNRRRASASEGHCSSDRGRSGAASPCGHLSRQRNPQHPFCCGHVGKGTSCKPVWGVPIPAGVGQQPRLQTVTPMRIARGWFHAHMPL